MRQTPTGRDRHSSERCCSSVPRYGMWYLGCMTEAVCKLKQSLQRLKERRKMVRKTEGTNDSVDAVEEYFDRLQTLR